MKLSLQSKLDVMKTRTENLAADNGVFHLDTTLNRQEHLILASILNDVYIGLEKDLNNKKLSELGATQLSNTLRVVNNLQWKVI